MKLVELLEVMNGFVEMEVYDHKTKQSVKVDQIFEDGYHNPLLTASWLLKEVFSVIPVDKMKISVTVY